MISPKFASTHYYFLPSALSKTAPNIVNLYLDYNCPFSAKIYLKLPSVIEKLNKELPGAFQFVFVNVVQPWHPNSVNLHEYSIAAAHLLRASSSESSNELFWKISKSIFEHKEAFYDSLTVNLGRNEIYQKIHDVVAKDVQLPFNKKDILRRLEIEATSKDEDAKNSGNDATVDLKYFTRYLRNVGVHVTPTVTVNGIVNDSISSGASEDDLVKIFESYLSE